jgi:hypothetical protein
MPHISIDHMSVDFVIYGTNSRSLKKQLVAQATARRAGDRGPRDEGCS